jgi:hypothetical protein
LSLVNEQRRRSKGTPARSVVKFVGSSSDAESEMEDLVMCATRARKMAVSRLVSSSEDENVLLIKPERTLTARKSEMEDFVVCASSARKRAASRLVCSSGDEDLLIIKPARASTARKKSSTVVFDLTTSSRPVAVVEKRKSGAMFVVDSEDEVEIEPCPQEAEVEVCFDGFMLKVDEFDMAGFDMYFEDDFWAPVILPVAQVDEFELANIPDDIALDDWNVEAEDIDDDLMCIEDSIPKEVEEIALAVATPAKIVQEAAIVPTREPITRESLSLAIPDELYFGIYLQNLK